MDWRYGSLQMNQLHSSIEVAKKRSPRGGSPMEDIPMGIPHGGGGGIPMGIPMGIPHGGLPHEDPPMGISLGDLPMGVPHGESHGGSPMEESDTKS